MSLGLKDYKPTYRQRPIAAIKNLYYEIKYAIQRFWRGYDDTYLFDFGYKLSELIPEVLLWLRYYRHGSPILRSEETCYEDWNEILDEILMHFREANDTNTSIKNEFDYEKEQDAWYAKEQKIEEHKAYHHKKAYQMISEYVGMFWD